MPSAEVLEAAAKAIYNMMSLPYSEWEDTTEERRGDYRAYVATAAPLLRADLEAENARLREANAKLVTDGAWIAGEVAALRPLVEAVREWQEAFKKYDKNCTLSGFQRLESAEQALSALALPEAK